ncbi:MAG TPA: hypothetical protein VK466_14215 [Terriglobales bacterium]|nr:hypothetical protein [Terriglobales bacterium]
MINALASIAGFAGPYAFAYLNSRTGSFSAGFVTLMGCLLAAGVLMLLIPVAGSWTSEAVALGVDPRSS